MQYPKRLIEVDLPIGTISAHARKEKSVGQVSTLHPWWARRPQAACRAILCASLWPDPADENCPQAFRDVAAEQLCAFAEKVRTDAVLMSICQDHWGRWLRTNSTSLRSSEPLCWPDLRYALIDFIADFSNRRAAILPAFLETARVLTQFAHISLGGIPGTHPLLVDSFAGGGSIPIEALRVGTDAFASDLNPVAVLLNKVLLEYLPRYGQQLFDEVKKWGEWIKEQAEKELAKFYPIDANGSTPIAYLWARTIVCEGPDCGATIPLIRSSWLAKNGDRSVSFKIIPNAQQKSIDIQIVEGEQESNAAGGTVRGTSAKCPICEYPTPAKVLRRQLKLQHGGTSYSRLLAVVTTQPNRSGRHYRLPNENDLEAVRRAEAAIVEIKSQNRGKSSSTIPDEPTPLGGGRGAGRAFSQRNYGMDTYADFFTNRQLLALITLVRLVKEVGEKLSLEKHYDKGLALAIQSILACAVDREAEHLSSLCRWNASGPKMQAAFGHQTLRIPWDYCEANIFGGSVGSWENILELVLTSFRTSLVIQNEGNVDQLSATSNTLPDNAAQIFYTDPPYYDAVPYADLSDFFYVWLKRTLGQSYPNLFGAELSPKADECVMDETKGHDKAYFEHMMGRAMAEGCRVLAPNGICTVVFAHKSTSGWEAQLQAMIGAGWTITASWPIDTEMGTRLRAMDSAALASSIHLVCRPRKKPDGSLRVDDIGDWREVLRELPECIHEWMPRLATEGVVGADAIFACLGPALEVFSRYSSVERADGERVTLREYLEYVWAAVSREALNMIFQGADTSGFEADARLTAMWLWTLSTSTAGKENGGEKSSGKLDLIEEDDEDEEDSNPRQVISGYVLEFDAARKIAQGLGANLDKLATIVEFKGSTARLRSVAERGNFLFEKYTGEFNAAKPRKREKVQQLAMFSVQELEETLETAGSGAGELPTFDTGKTTLDRLHQAMLLFATGRSEVLRRFLREDGVGTDQRFWRLAQALSSLYPQGSEERRWVEGVQGFKKILGL